MTNRIDFQVVFSVDHANPNGDPLDGNRPRQLADGRGEVSDVCIKRKIRNRLAALGENVLIKSSEQCKKDDEEYSVEGRYAEAVNEGKKITKLSAEQIQKGLEEFADIRLFGQVYAFLGDKASSGEHTRGAVSVTSAISVSPIEIHETQITKSISNLEKDRDKKGSDTMGMKYDVPFGVYVFFGSINARIADENGVTPEDIALLQKALCTLFHDDASTARPFGSMNVEKVIWYKHNSLDGQVRPDIVKDALTIKLNKSIEVPSQMSDYHIQLDDIEGLVPQIFDKPW